jgi:hypothetical protein
MADNKGKELSKEQADGFQRRSHQDRWPVCFDTLHIRQIFVLSPVIEPDGYMEAASHPSHYSSSNALLIQSDG